MGSIASQPGLLDEILGCEEGHTQGYPLAFTHTFLKSSIRIVP